MKQFRRCSRTLILCLFFLTVLVPLVFVSNQLTLLTAIERKDFSGDLSTLRYRTDPVKLEALKQEDIKELEGPKRVVYQDKDFVSSDSSRRDQNSDSAGTSVDLGLRNNPFQNTVPGINNHRIRQQLRFQQSRLSLVDGEKKEPKQTAILQSEWQTRNEKFQGKRNGHSDINVAKDEKIKEMKDQIIRARAYLSFAPPTSNSHLVKELKLRVKETEQAMGEATKDSDLPRRVLQRIRRMEASLDKASRVYPDCFAMAQKLRAMNYNAEEQFRTQRDDVHYLLHLASRTASRGLHCLSMRLTMDYFDLQPEQRKLPNGEKLNDPDLHHYAIFSDNVLACAVVVNSTVTTAKAPEKIVFHLVTNSLNLPAISAWFLVNPPGRAMIQIQCIDNFEWLFKDDILNLKNQNSTDPRYSSELNYLRFYLPDLFPALRRIVLLDHDVVVQQDLAGLWTSDMKGKVIGVVESCRQTEASFHRINALINFSDPYVAKNFDENACAWAFGMNLIDLQEWKRQNLTAVYRKYLQMGSQKPMWAAGSLPLGWVTFYNKTVALDRRWHFVGLGQDIEARRDVLEKSAVIHYDGVRKPWLDTARGSHKHYWNKFLNFDHPYLQRCNLHD